jgi:hypothetical protein
MVGVVNTKHFPIEKLAFKATAPYFQGKDGLFVLNRSVTDAQFAVINKMLTDGYTPCKPARITIEIRIEQEALPMEATDGKVVELEEHVYDIVKPLFSTKNWLVEK